MKKLTAEWVRKAEADYRLAVKLGRGSEPFHDQRCFHCQQATEKYLKALMEELGLTDYALERFALAGNPNAWIKRIEEIAGAGATKLWLNAEGGNLDRQLHYMRLLGEKIMSRFV